MGTPYPSMTPRRPEEQDALGATPFPASRHAPTRQSSGGGSNFLFPGATPVGGVHASPGCTPTSFGSPAPFSLAGAGIEAGARYGGPARTPGVALGSGLPPHYVPPASASARGTTGPSAACADTDAPPLRSLFDLPAAAAPADAHPAPTPATGGPQAGAGAPPAGHPPESEHWVTVFGYTSPAMVPQVLELLRPSAGSIVHQIPGSGNWFHLRLSSWQQQQQLLALHSRVIHSSMIGVLPGILPVGSLSPGAVPNAAPRPAAPLSLARPRAAAGGMGGGVGAYGGGKMDETPGVLMRLSELLFGW